MSFQMSRMQNYLKYLFLKKLCIIFINSRILKLGDFNNNHFNFYQCDENSLFKNRGGGTAKVK